MHRLITATWCLLLVAATSAWAQTSYPPAPALTTQLITNAVSDPIGVVHAPNDHARIFIIGRFGKIRVVKDGTLLANPFLNISSIVRTDFERGLLGMAFDPNYSSNGYFYVRYNNLNGNTVLARYHVSTSNPDLADPASAYIMLTIGVSTTNHNGGSIEFGPDGFLYLTIGDGYNSDNAQNLGTLLGKLLRLDVHNDGFPSDPNRNYAIPPGNPFGSEIWAYGLRNPFRFGFDHLTGDLWTADVGNTSWEEIDVQPAGQAGLNYGWPCMESDVCSGNTQCVCDDPALTMPVFEYDHSLGCAVIGGRIYRGCAIPSLSGTYFCADWCSGRIWSFQYVNGSLIGLQERQNELAPPGGGPIGSIDSFGEDAHGELYICSLTGKVYKIVTVIPPADNNGNGIPDSCEGSGSCDVTGDWVMNVDDLLGVINSWGPCPAPPASCAADVAPWGSAGNGVVNVDDLLAVINHWGPCP